MSARLSPASPWVPCDVERLRSMAAAGLTMAYAATELGRAHCAVKCKAMRLGISFPRKGWRQPGPGFRRDYELDAIIGSRRLRDAILSLIKS